MFERKLSALQYSRPSVNVEDESEFRNLVYWLESMKIRFYSPNDRSFLLPDSRTWNESYQKYLNDIKYQGYVNDKKITLDWLLNLALRYEMEDTRAQMQISTQEISDLINLDSTGDFSNIDFSSPKFIAELKDISAILNVPFYEEEPLVTLRAIAILLCKLRRLSRNNTQSSDPQKSSNQCKKKKILSKVDENILNIKFGKNCKYDPILNRCANVLRLLYIKDLRELQTNINNVIVQVQSVTANPKTDSTLGKVGR